MGSLVLMLLAANMTSEVSMEDALDRSHTPGDLQDKMEMFNKGQITLDNELVNPNSAEVDDSVLRKA